ncbi:uncharacterized protein LOC122076435 [Macadamia integrifolia]|uniref:uncharacterized protein LOC122076435 n=1 Tax=Macadamia integrifolia TaxID=60698 RepID=UPI001C4F4C88|nr:uncharacterized protein LOC122076435 [Macadamia integrifolia]
MEGVDSLSLDGNVNQFVEDYKWRISAVNSTFMNGILDAVMNINILDYDCDDRCAWSLNHDGIFSSKSAWEDIRLKKPNVPWASLIWCKKQLPQISTLTWRVIHGTMPTDDAVKKRSVTLASKCELCKTDEETMGHIFLHCSFSREIWGLLCECFNVR